MWPSSRWGQTPGSTRDKRRMQDQRQLNPGSGRYHTRAGSSRDLTGSYSAVLCRCIGMELLAAVALTMRRRTTLSAPIHALGPKRTTAARGCQPRPGLTDGARLPLAAEYHAIPPSRRRGATRHERGDSVERSAAVAD